MAEDFLTEDEKVLYDILYTQCKKVCKNADDLTERLFESVLGMCDIFSLTKHIELNFSEEYTSQLMRLQERQLAGRARPAKRMAAGGDLCAARKSNTFHDSLSRWRDCN